MPHSIRGLLRIFTISFVSLAAAGATFAADWQMAPAQLKTRWTDQVSPTNARPEYPRPQMKRKDWLNLNGVWDIGLGEAQHFDQKILVPFPIESALSGIEKHDDHAWYRRTFQIPKEWGDRRVLLHFGAVDWQTTVWINGKQVGEHRGGYDPFSFDITDAIKPDGDNEIIVAVFDPTDTGGQPIGKQRLKPQGIWYTSTTGIWQTVWLEPVNDAHIDSVEITPDVDHSAVRVRLNVSGAAKDLPATVSVLDDQTPIASTDGNAGEPIVVPIKDAKLWSPDSPFLYNLRISLGKPAAAADSIDSYVGMRKIEIKSDGQFNRIFLNDKPITLIGPLDQGFWPDGIYTAPTDEAMKYDLVMTKKLGFNMIRKHVKVEPATWYEACDRLGICIWQDMPSMFPSKELAGDPQVRKQFESELSALIDTHRNSPCIVMWVVFNEGWGEYDTQRLTRWVQQADPTRLVDDASGWTDRDAGNVLDMHKYPGPGAPATQPTRAIVLGEFGGLGLGIDGHTWVQKKFSYKQMDSQAQLTDQYCHLLSDAWKLIHENGLCACVYTQTTDVEGEINGLMTYDRQVLKVDADRARAANLGEQK